MTKLSLILFYIFLPLQLMARPAYNLLGISQGISSPTTTSTINFSNGFTHENPVGVAYQNSLRLSGHYDNGNDSSGNNNDGLGAEFGVGNGKIGFTVGYYDRDCNACDGQFAGAVGGFIGDIGLGLRFQEDYYSLGLMLNANSKHRFGFMAELNDPSGSNNSIQSFGAGYAYVNQQVTFSVDASKRSYENQTINDDEILVTPGLAFRFDMIAFSISYDMYLNDNNSPNNNENQIWWGLGIGTGQDWHIALYGDYVNEWALAGSIFF